VPKKNNCPYCKSFNSLPFEEETRKNQNHTFTIILISAFVLLGSYFLFVIFSYIAYPLMIILLISLSAFILNKKEKQNIIKEKSIEKEFICLDCNRSFKQQM